MWTGPWDIQQLIQHENPGTCISLLCASPQLMRRRRATLGLFHEWAQGTVGRGEMEARVRN
jgi:hypothetical protein